MPQSPAPPAGFTDLDHPDHEIDLGLYNEDDGHDLFEDWLGAPPIFSFGSGPEDLTWEDAETPSWDLDPNYRHLGQDLDPSPFSFTAMHLQNLFACNGWLDRVEAADPDRVLFALRGCALPDDADDSGGQQGILTLHEVPIDFVHHRCLIGVWERRKGTLGAVKANTVPAWHYLKSTIIKRTANPAVGGGSSCVMPGMYQTQVGPHSRSKGQYPDAIRMGDRESYTVWRPGPGRQSIGIDVRDTVWKSGNYGHNIHPSSGSRHRDTNKKFHYSAGCCTLPGWCDGKNGYKNSWCWQAFRDLLDMPECSVKGGPATPYLYALLTGRDARMSLGGDWDGLRRIRHGTEGPHVASLRAALGLKGSGPADGHLIHKVAIKRWYDKAESADGAITQADVEALGGTWVPRLG